MLKKLTAMCLTGLLTLLLACQSGTNGDTDADKIALVHNEQDQKVDVLVDGQLFTSFMYTDQMSVLKKPVLYPLVTANGNKITRRYPLEQVAGERDDHPHHIGYWLNYGDVNGLDFWNNSDAIKPERAPKMGTIRLKEIKKVESGASGELIVVNNWMNHAGDILLEEEKFNFLYLSDVRGDMPFFPVVDGKRLNTLQIPQTLPTTHECLQAQKATRDTVIEFILNNYLIEEGLNVFTVHDWLEGLSGNCLAADFIEGALADLLRLFEYSFQLLKNSPQYKRHLDRPI